MSGKTRKVKKRNGRVNLSKGRLKTKAVSKASLIATAKRLNRTRTRRFIVYAVMCILSMQLIRYIIYNFIYVGSETPSGIVFTGIIYLQTGLMVASLGFLAAASITYLNSLRD